MNLFRKLPFWVTLALLLVACNAGGTGEPPATPAIFSTSTQTTQSTAAPSLSLSPAPLPTLSGSGGGIIAFTSLVGNDWQIHLINADGSGELRVDTAGGYEPSWSPDGKKIVFQYQGLWILDLVSSKITRLPQIAKSAELPNPYLVKPSWSPDGEWIAFINESGEQGDIYIVRPDGTGLTRLTNTDDISRDGDLVWSPDSARIAYSANRGGNIEIFMLEVEAARQGNPTSRQLTDTAAPVWNLVTSWSRDGARLAFSSDRDDNMEIYMMNPDGSDVVRLTNNPAHDAEPVWSPDGKHIAFSSDRYGGNLEICILDVAEAVQSEGKAGVTQLTEYSGKVMGPVWQPCLDVAS